MARSLWEVSSSLLRRGGEDDEENEDDRFVPSRLDSSVRVAHGGTDDEVERELNKIEQQAQELEENHPDQ